MHELSKWIFRAMIVLGIIGFGSIYLMRNGLTIAEMPKVFDAAEQRPAAIPPPVPAPAAPVPAPAVSAAPTAAPAERFAPCQPIGRTARGELVYSMDCAQLPAVATAVPDGEKK
jgi:hypothetical protein